MECPDILISLAGCVTLPLSKAGQLVQQCVAPSIGFLGAYAGWWAAMVIGTERSDGHVE